ncbi:MAG: aldehyde dehydrogenase family protein, partial [Parasporobacterium sp.]|nr:aldehyde dehydrogenase family protein [Parasporobacterium sp.]
MLDGFKNAVELDFSLEEHKKGMEEAFARIDAQKGTVYPLIIGGERIFTDKKIASADPATKEVLAYSSSCTKELADKAIRCAYDAFQTWSLTPVDERIRVLRRLSALLMEERYFFNAWNVSESGKNWGEADGELCEQLDFMNSYVMHIRQLDKGLELVQTEEHNKS